MCVFFSAASSIHPFFFSFSVVFFTWLCLALHTTVLLAFLIQKKSFYFFSFHFVHPSKPIHSTPTKNRSAPLYIFKTTVVRVSKSYRPTNKFNTSKELLYHLPYHYHLHYPVNHHLHQAPYIYVNHHHHHTQYFCMNEIKY